MGVVQRNEGAGVRVLGLTVGRNVYAVRLDRVATVLEAEGLGPGHAGEVLKVSGHEVAVSAASDVLGEDARDGSTLVVFRGRDDDGRVLGWLVDGVTEPETVDDVEITAGAVRHVRGRVDLDGESAVLLDPAKTHPS